MASPASHDPFAVLSLASAVSGNNKICLIRTNRGRAFNKLLSESGKIPSAFGGHIITQLAELGRD